MTGPHTDADDVTELARGRFLRLAARDGWEFVQRVRGSGAVLILAVTPADEVLLVEQYRPPVARRVIELPAGLVGDEPSDADTPEAAEDAVRRELEEETGYRAATVTRLGGGPSSPGSSAESVGLYRAAGLEQIGEGGGIAGEAITVHRVPRADVARWCRAREREGALIDVRIFAALFLDEAPADAT
ncbi:NUDIX hydrolase [Roseisolibacter sp. H3M3-2]|uniref:NUDIX hydrolase n=1 Tax=Roseisolibacter sp. H3M3-2 TaxID=3031323 RepID=UPI0023DA61D1|nr:NUDIX hydrolase [Roseisolibacter sp. H3M3-2]MDF1503685.1 NUDIX hydrolase [Roseisolibacter sp. H3M3-2]